MAFCLILFFNKTIKTRFIACEPPGSQAKALCAFEEAVQYQSRAKQLLCAAQHSLHIKRLIIKRFMGDWYYLAAARLSGAAALPRIKRSRYSGELSIFRIS